MPLPIYQVDAFADAPFAGNPAAVVPLDSWRPDSLLQEIAAENNLSETAFLVKASDGEADYHLRWFTPRVEVDLCGHATLAAAHVLFARRGHAGERLRFATRSGALTVRRREDGMLELDFPANPPAPAVAPAGLPGALGADPEEVLRAGKFLFCVLRSESVVRGLTPDITALARAIPDEVIVSAAASTDGNDFVSRMFAPNIGIDEDPVTGAAHCVSVPYWARRLGRDRLRAYQASRRGGALDCRLDGDRVRIAGHAVLFMEGSIHV